MFKRSETCARRVDPIIYVATDPENTDFARLALSARYKGKRILCVYADVKALMRQTPSVPELIGPPSLAKLKAVRVFNQYNTLPDEIPLTFAIPVGVDEDHPYTDADLLEVVAALQALTALIDKHGYEQIYWASDLDGNFATRRGYGVSKNIVAYITAKLPLHCK